MGDDSRPPATGYPVHSYPPQQPSSAAAYPYPAQQPNPYFYNNSNGPYQAQLQQTYYVDQQRTAFIRRFIAGMMAVSIILGCIFLVTWLVLRPKFPEFTIDYASLTGFNLSSNYISGAWDFSVTVYNPNKKLSLVYEDVQSNLAYESNSIADNTLAPFVQGKRISTTIRVPFVASAAYLKDKARVDLSAERIRADGTVGFEVRIYSRVLFHSGIWRISRRLLRVFCYDVRIAIPPSRSGNMTSGPKGCRVGW